MDFKRPRYMDGAWLDTHLWWNEEDKKLLAAAVDTKISYTDAANTLGRQPYALWHQAIKLFGYWNMPLAWKKHFNEYKPKKKHEGRLQYPYIVKPDDKYADLIAVNRLVSHAMPGREDVCQDIMLALWESRTSLQELKDDPRAIRSFIKAFRRAYFEKNGYGVESMDITLYVDDNINKYEHSKYQKSLINNDDEFLEDLIFGERGKGYTPDSSNLLIEQISREEEEIGVPAALWMRAEKF
jgi:hypothetical protein